MTKLRPEGHQSRHIGGTSARDLLGSAENCQDLNRWSSHVMGAFAKVGNMPAQDPAFRPTPD